MLPYEDNKLVYVSKLRRAPLLQDRTLLEVSIP